MAVRAPLDFVMGVTGGTPNVRLPLDFLDAVTGGQPHVRVALDLLQAVTGGNPHIRVSLAFLHVVFPEPEPLPVATIVFPSLRGGLKWDRGKSPSFNNARREMTSGRRSVTPFMVYPRWNFELSYDVLPDQGLSGLNNTLATLQEITDLYKQTQGGAVTFLYQDPEDFHVVGGTIATADGVTLQWPFFAAVMSNTLEPAGQIDLSLLATFASTAVNATTDAINIPGHGMTAGQYPPMFIANTGGSLPTGLAASTPYWPIVVDADHIKLAASEADALSATAIDITAAGSGTDTLSKGYAIYDNGAIVNPGSGLSAVGLTLPNQLVFATAPTSGHAITADFDYYFVCRFDDDKLELNEFVSKLFDLQKLNFSSEIQ